MNKKKDEIQSIIKQNKKIVKHIKSIQTQLDWIIMVLKGWELDK